MTNKVPVGVSTITLIIAALTSVGAFFASWAQSGSAPTWLGLVSAALVALLGFFRSWQAVNAGGQPVDESSMVVGPPTVPTDTTATPPQAG